MNLGPQSAKHLRDVFFGGNWTTTHVQEVLQNINWKQANAKIESFNTIVALTYHIGYFVSAILQVMKGGPLDSQDKFSFDHPGIQSEEDWQRLKTKLLTEVQELAEIIAQLPDDQFFDNFVESKYGNNFRNFHGLIEHTHYHLGQIVIIKKLIGNS